jgi:TrmH family RNA methyltransferase
MGNNHVAESGQIISSPANPFLKDIRRAVARGAVTSEGCLVAESFHLLHEALRSRVPVRAILAAQSAAPAVKQCLGGDFRQITLRIIEDRVFQQLASTETSQGVIALVEAPQWKMDDLFAGLSLVVVLDGIQDPGNAGAITRSAEAFGATGVLFLRGSVSPFNPKTLRASAGSLFRLPYLFGIEPELARSEFKQRNVRLLAASPRAEQSLERVNLRIASALVIGSEAHGVSEALRSDSDVVRIPTRGVESLNAAAAAAVILYEAARQRSRPAGDSSPGEQP